MHTKYINDIGKKFGLLTVKKCYCSGKNNHNVNIYKFICLCECGNVVKRQCSYVKNNRTTSCGCRRDQYKKITGEKSPLFTGYKDISGKYWAMLKQSARMREHVFNIDIKDAWKLFINQNQKCALTGIQLTFPVQSRTTDWKEYTASLDRIDSKKGYTIDNVQWIHKDVNLMKQQYTNEYFIVLCNFISQMHPINTTDIDLKTIQRGGRFGKTKNGD
jgi:hypothetical protein